MHQAEESSRWELADFIFDRLGPRTRTALKIWAVWTLLGCVMAIQSHYRMALMGKGRPWYSVLFAEFSYTWMWALLTPVVLFMARRFPLTRVFSWRIPGHLMTGISMAILTHISVLSRACESPGCSSASISIGV
ncbi:MAG: hypothetical protein FJW40_15625 [Acidobacteria bacterium]|nr:hypothetical protein [Acidobacteriota bacterium]